MSQLLFINTYFEEEAAGLQGPSPQAFLQRHPVYFQLQYLALLVAREGEVALVSHRPDAKYFEELTKLGPFVSDCICWDDALPSGMKLDSWGASPSVERAARKKGMHYEKPPWDLVREVNSKAFSFVVSPKLPGARLLRHQDELTQWWHSFSGPRVLKTLYGSSGRGHFISQGTPEDLVKALFFLQRELTFAASVLGEPWVDRVLDFSSQWKIEKTGACDYVGSTVCENSSRGVYQRSIVGPESSLFSSHLDALKEHLIHAEKIVHMLASLGFYGAVGFDAMIYKDRNGVKRVHPVVEINARKTMGWVALRLHRKLGIEGLLSVSYRQGSDDVGFLPNFLSLPNGKIVSFNRRLLLETV